MTVAVAAITNPKPGSAGLSATEEDWGDDYPKTFSVNLIWGEARDKEGRAGAIGLNGGMPWHCAEDMKHFKELTVSHPVIIGRRGHGDRLGGKYRPLPNRDNIVVSHDPMYRAPGATVVTSLDDALDMARQEAIPDDGLDRFGDLDTRRRPAVRRGVAVRGQSLCD